VPGWYEQLSPHLISGKLRAVGIIQEQHGDRTRLFNQWKRLDKMTLLIDSLNRLDVSGVPIVLFVDRHGIIRNRNPRPSELDDFISTKFDNDEDARAIELPTISGDPFAIAGRWDDAIAKYSTHLRENPSDDRAMFRLGVCYRSRFDGSAKVDPRDFAHSIDYWQAALVVNPNQYIWRRRIQQYGPILSKPYPFYDWVDQAFSEIRQRGEAPVVLRTAPKGAELVGPSSLVSSGLKVANTTNQEPDPSGAVSRDSGLVVTINSAVVQSTEKKQSARVHLLMQPNADSDFHWNNEADPVRVWVATNDTLTVHQSLVEFPQDAEATSNEIRTAEFEVSWDDSVSPPEGEGSKILSGYAVYHICNKTTGVCVFWRQDIQIDVLANTKKGQP
jgi:hypothetical protein